MKNVFCPASPDTYRLFLSFCFHRKVAQRIVFFLSDLRKVHPHVETHLTILNRRSSTQLSTCVGPLGYCPRLQATHDCRHDLRQIPGNISTFLSQRLLNSLFSLLPDFIRRALMPPYDFPYGVLGLEDTSPEALFEASTSVDQSSLSSGMLAKCRPLSRS